MPKLTVNIELETQAEIDALYRICKAQYTLLDAGRSRDHDAIDVAHEILALLEPMITKEGK